MNNEELKFSVLSSFYDKEPVDMTLGDVMDLIRSESLVSLTEQIRNLRVFSEDPAQKSTARLNAKSVATSFKQKLPSMLTNVFCRGGKTRSNIVHFMPALGFDIDHLSTERTLELMEVLRQDPHVLFAEPSCSRQGLHTLISIDCADWLNHLWDKKDIKPFHFVVSRVQEYVEKLLGEPCDKKCSNPERIFGICADEKAFYHPQAAPFHVDVSAYGQKQEKSKAVKNVAASTYHYTLDEVKEAIENQLESEGCRFVAANHNNYIFRFASLCNAYGVDLEEVKTYAQNYLLEGNVTDSEISRSVNSAYNHTEALGTRKLKIHPQKSRVADLDTLESYISEYGTFRFNSVTQGYEVCQKGNTGYREMCDEDENEIYRRVMGGRFNTSVIQIRNIIHSHRAPHFHPFRDYMEGLPACKLLDDGTCMIEGRDTAVDYIADFASRVTTSASSDVFLHYFKIWFVAMVKSMIHDHEINQYVLGLVGKQGIFKTTFFQRLLPPVLQRQYFYLKTNSSRLDKDDKLKMANNALICLEEMDTMTDSEQNQFKAVVTSKSVDERPPYGRNVVHMPRLCSFCITGNNNQLLTDTTGNRRLFLFEVESIDDPRTFTDYEALYAQAFALARDDSGFLSYVPFEDINKLNEQNEQFMSVIREHEMVDKYLEIPSPDSNAAIFDSATGICNYLENYTKAHLSSKKIGDYLKKRGFVHKKTNTGVKYRIYRRTADEVESVMKRDARSEVTE